MLAFSKSINTITRCTMQYRSHKLANIDINGPQSTYILHICHHPGVSQDALAKMIYINKSNVTRQLTDLEAKGFIVRKNSAQDHRIIEVYPTQKALDALPEIIKVLHEWNSYITEDLSGEEKEIFFQLLLRITDRAKHYIDAMKEE